MPGPPAIRLRIGPEIGGRVRVGVVAAEPVAVAAADPALVAAMTRLAADLARRHEGRAPAEIDELRPARELYRAFGVDPTKVRPSSEALLRRALAGKPLPRISNAVDVANLLALHLLLSIGLYDAAKIGVEVELRRGRPAESYAGIRKEDVHLDGRLVLADDRGPFGNPTSDSLRASVDAATTKLWLVIFAPASRPPQRLADDVRLARELLERHLAPAGAAVITTGAVLP